MDKIDKEKTTRLEVIDHRHEAIGKGRLLVVNGVSLHFEVQDMGRTLKIFIDNKKEKNG